MSVLKQQCLPKFFTCLAKNMADYNVNCNSVVVVVFFFIRDKCSFGKNIVVRDELIFFSDMPGNRVHVIDVQQQKVLNGFLH